MALSGGTPKHYLCDDENGWSPDLEDLESKITDHTRGIVVINPNNPTGAVYPRETLAAIVDIARRHDLIVFADEIYEKITYNGVEMVNLATLTGDDVLCLTYSGLSKAYRIAGYRAGWLAITGPLAEAKSYIEGITLLANMRMCANVPAQHAIQAALGGRQSIEDLVLPTGRLGEQMAVAHAGLNAIDGVSARKADGALYLFAKLDTERFGITDDEQFALDLLREQKILISHGTAFNWSRPDHFRLVTLPSVDVLEESIGRLGEFLSGYHQVAPTTCERPSSVMSRARPELVGIAGPPLTWGDGRTPLLTTAARQAFAQAADRHRDRPRRCRRHRCRLVVRLRAERQAGVARGRGARDRRLQPSGRHRLASRRR